MPLPPLLAGRLSLPVIAAPLFIISHPALTIGARYRVPMLITSLRAPGDVVKEAHAWGGI